MFYLKYVFCTFVGFSPLEPPIIVSLSCFCPMYLLAMFSFFIFIYLFIWLQRVLVVACGIRLPDQGSNLGPAALGPRSLSHWTTRTFSCLNISPFHQKSLVETRPSMLMVEQSTMLILFNKLTSSVMSI